MQSRRQRHTVKRGSGIRPSQFFFQTGNAFYSILLQKIVFAVISAAEKAAILPNNFRCIIIILLFFWCSFCTQHIFGKKERSMKN